MARVKRSVHAKKKRREVLANAKGYAGTRKRYRAAKEQVTCSACTPIATAGTARPVPPSVDRAHQRRRPSARSVVLTVHQWAQARGIEVDRKILADLAVNDPAAFAAGRRGEGRHSRRLIRRRAEC